MSDQWRRRRDNKQAFKVQDGQVPITGGPRPDIISPPTLSRPPQDHPWRTLPNGERMRVKKGKREYGYFTPTERLENILFEWYSTDQWHGQIASHEIEPMRKELDRWLETHRDEFGDDSYHAMNDALRGDGYKDPFESLLEQGYLSRREYEKNYIFLSQRGVTRAEQLHSGSVSGEHRIKPEKKDREGHDITQLKQFAYDMGGGYVVARNTEEAIMIVNGGVWQNVDLHAVDSHGDIGESEDVSAYSGYEVYFDEKGKRRTRPDFGEAR